MRTKSHSQKKEKRAYNRTFYVGLVPELYFILSKLCILQTAVYKIENLGTCLQNEYKHSDPADGGTTFFHVAVKIKFLVVALIKDSLTIYLKQALSSLISIFPSRIWPVPRL